jgi:hypothetical protein
MITGAAAQALAVSSVRMKGSESRARIARPMGMVFVVMLLLRPASITVIGFIFMSRPVVDDLWNDLATSSDLVCHYRRGLD